MHPDNLIPANPYSTPAHIVPEWYFLWVYAILRSIPNKAGGILAIGLTFIGIAALPFLSLGHVGSPKFRIIHERLFWVLVADLFLLTWVGAQEIMPATVILGQVGTLVLFTYLFILLPLLGWLESSLVLKNASL